MQDMPVNELNKRVMGINAVVLKFFESDFPNYDFYQPVFSYNLAEGSVTAACMS